MMHQVCLLYCKAHSVSQIAVQLKQTMLDTGDFLHVGIHCVLLMLYHQNTWCSGTNFVFALCNFAVFHVSSSGFCEIFWICTRVPNF